MIINIIKSSTGTLDTEMVFTCHVCGRTFNHNDYEFPARWEDAIRKHLIKAHGGKRIGHNLIELPSPHDDEEHSIQGAGLVVGCSTAQGPHNRGNLQHNDDSSSELFSGRSCTPPTTPSLEESPEGKQPSGAVLNGTSGDQYDYWPEGGEE